MTIILTFDKCIGEGGYGRVFTSSTEGYKNFVFKVFFDKHEPPPCLEIDSVFRLRHPNIMSASNILTINKLPNPKKVNGFESKGKKVKGVPEKVELFEDGRGSYFVFVMERAKCDLHDWKVSLKQKKVDDFLDDLFEVEEVEENNRIYRNKIKIIWEILMAVYFIHKCGLLHLDIKTENVLIMDDGTAKLTDFGLAVVITNHGRYRKFNREMITSNYRPPENFDKCKYSEKYRDYYRQTSDVWSMGILMCEIFMETNLIDPSFVRDKEFHKLDSLFSHQNAKSTIYSRIGRGITKEQKNEWCDLLLEMLNLNPTERPTIKEVMKKPIFEKYGYYFKDIEELGHINHPIFPPADSKITNEDYKLKLEHFIYDFTHFIFNYYKKKTEDENYPLKMIFVAADTFLRNIHHYMDRTDYLIAFTIYNTTQLCCEYEVTSEVLEKYYSFAKKTFMSMWREFMFKNEVSKGILMTDTPFSKANCKCRVEWLLNILYKEPEKYIELVKDEEFTSMDSLPFCGVEPKWDLIDWAEFISKFNPKFKIK